MKRITGGMVFASLLLSGCGDDPTAASDTVATVQVGPADASLLVGDTLRLTASPRSSRGGLMNDVQVEWSSSDAEYAAVDPQGLVTARRAGDATIRASAGGRTGSATIDIANPLPVLETLEPAAAGAGSGPFVLTVRGTGFSPDARVQWNGQDRPTSYVSTTMLRASIGNADILAAGGALVRVTSPAPGGGTSAEALFTVSSSSVASVEVTPATASVTAGATVQLHAQPKSVSGQELEGRGIAWSSQTDSIATVSADGLVTGVRPGTVTVTAMSEGVAGSASVTVTPAPVGPVASVELDVDSLPLEEAAFQPLTATARDANGEVVTGRTVQWSTSDVGIVHVDAAGMVRGIRPGTAVVTAKVDGSTASVPVRVWADHDYDLLFSAAPAGGTSEIFMLDISQAGVASQRILAPGTVAGGATGSPDDGRIAFSGVLAGVPGLYVAERDGSNPALLWATAECGGPAWSPNGARLAVTCRPASGGSEIWLLDASDGGERVNLTAAQEGNQAEPSWSPVQPGGGYRIAYEHYVNGEPQIWTMRASDGGDAVQVTAGMDMQPAWSPDGTTIAFIRTGAATFGDPYLVDATGGNERMATMTALAGPQFAPAWSPDGTLLAFLSSHETYGSGAAVYQVYTVRPDRSGLARRTSDASTSKGAPDWITR